MKHVCLVIWTATCYPPPKWNQTNLDKLMPDNLLNKYLSIPFDPPSTRRSQEPPCWSSPKGQCRLPVTSNEVPRLLRCHWSSAHCHPEWMGGTGGQSFSHGPWNFTQRVLCGFLSLNILNTSWVSWHVFFQIKDAVNSLNNIWPIGSMGLVYLPTWMVDLYEKCRQIYRSAHGSYGLYFSTCLFMLPRYNRDKQGSIWLFSNLQKYAKKLPIENKT